jgi:molybdopterin-guanine dinucleotide biosynthesis protein A
MPANDMPGVGLHAVALETTGALLAGGRSSRMGRDKGPLTIGGKPMIEHVIARLRPQVHRILISGNDEEPYSGYCVPVVPDVIGEGETGEERAGPLAGLHAALLWAQSETPDARFLLTVPVDTPFLPRDLTQRLAEGLHAGGATSAIAASNGRRHPVVGLWSLELLAAVTASIKEGVRAMHRFAEQQTSAVVDFSCLTARGVSVDPFFNVNTPDDLERAETLFAALALAESMHG